MLGDVLVADCRSKMGELGFAGTGHSEGSARAHKTDDRREGSSDSTTIGYGGQ